MTSCIQGYNKERFATTVSRNFLCLLCFNVLKDPVLCPRNQHCFCRGCITKHLENSRRCPTCADELTEETLTEPNKIVKDYLSELKTRCVYHDRGCQEIVQLQYLDLHEDSCGFTPAVCTNDGCSVTLNKRDLIHHESELCGHRKLKCHSCGELAKTVSHLEKRVTNVDKNIGTMEKNTVDMKGELEQVSNDVRGLKADAVERFDELNEVLVKMENKIEKNAKKVRNAPLGDRENIIVAGCSSRESPDSVEIFNWRQRTWLPLQSMPNKRWGATSFVYNNEVFIAGGVCNEWRFDTMIRMNVDSTPDLLTHWSGCPVELPAKLEKHSSVLDNDKLMVTGGYDGNATSDKIHEVQVVPPYTVKTLSRMPKPRQGHCTEIFDDRLLIQRQPQQCRTV